MKLCEFIDALIHTGSVTLAGSVDTFEEEDLLRSQKLLQDYYTRDALEMPGTPPSFDEEAALWAAIFLYRAMQFTLLRSEEATTVQNTLAAYTGDITPEIMYSADLCLRYLPPMLGLAQGLAPEDVLVTCIQTVATQFPLSAVGIRLPGDNTIPGHPSLRAAYTDRIITLRDTQRYQQDGIVKALVTEALGNHTASLWPGLITA